MSCLGGDFDNSFDGGGGGNFSVCGMTGLIALGLFVDVVLQLKMIGGSPESIASCDSSEIFLSCFDVFVIRPTRSASMLSTTCDISGIVKDSWPDDESSPCMS